MNLAADVSGIDLLLVSANEINNLAGVLHDLAKDYFFTTLPDDPTRVRCSYVFKARS